MRSCKVTSCLCLLICLGSGPVAAALQSTQPRRQWRQPASRPARQSPATMPAGGMTQIKRLELKNGVRVALIPLAGSDHISVMTYLPLGVCRDTPGHALWSRLLANIIRTTPGSPLTRESRAEVFADCSYLGFQRPAGDWKDAVGILSRWLSRREINDVDVRRSTRALLDEIRRDVEKGMTHSCAAAAWSQSLRTGQSHVDIKTQIKNATATDLRDYLERTVLTGPRPLLVIGGKFNEPELTSELERRIGTIVFPPQTASAPSSAPATRPNVPREMTWDLATRHLVFYWPIAGVEHESFPHLLAGSLGLMYWWNKFDVGYRPPNGVFVDPETQIDGRQWFTVNTTLSEPVAENRAKARVDEERTVGDLMTVNAQNPEQAAQTRQNSRGQLQLRTTQLQQVNSILAQAAAANMDHGPLDLEILTHLGLFEYRYGDRIKKFHDAMAHPDDAAAQRIYQKWLSPSERRELLITPRAVASQPVVRQPDAGGPPESEPPADSRE